MTTGFVCPSRHTRASAWRSFAGFQSESNRTSRFAPTRLSPTPPALQLSRNTSPPRPSLKRFTSPVRRFGATLPSRREIFPRIPSVDSHIAWTTSRVDVNPDTTTKRSRDGDEPLEPGPERPEEGPEEGARASSRARTASFPLIPGWCAGTFGSAGSAASAGRRRACPSPRASLSSGASPRPSRAAAFVFSSASSPLAKKSFAELHSRCSLCRAVSGVDLRNSPRVVVDLRHSAYSAACVGVRRQKTTYSVLGGSASAWISAADARWTNGAVSLPSSLDRYAPTVRSASLAPFSRLRSIGAAKIRLNLSRSPRRPGHAKSTTAKNSPRSFWTGVPLSKTRRSHRSFRSAANVCVSPLAFFSLCASSHTSTSTPPVQLATRSACVRSVS